VPRCTEAGRLLLDDGLGKAAQLIEEDLLLFRLRLKNVDERDEVILSGNMHLFSPPGRIPGFFHLRSVRAMIKSGPLPA
jgi:hypothetical protein